MITTANMGLIVWDQETDDFEHSQLANNFERIDGHSHEGGLSSSLNVHDEMEENGHWESLGKGLPIRTSAIEPEAIQRYLLKIRSVGHFQIDKEGVERENLASKVVDTDQIEDEAVGTAQVSEHAITIDELDPNIISLGHVALWFKYSEEAEPGNIWVVCDGRPWSEIPNNLGLSAGNIPNMIEKFARGSNLFRTGESGGSPNVNLTHTHTSSAAAFNHTHLIGAHNHVIEESGLHSHSFAGGFAMHTRQNAFTNELTLRVEGRPNWYESLYIAAPFYDHDGAKIEPPFDEDVSVDAAGLHNHGGFTGLSAAYNTGGSSLSGSVETSEALTEVNVTPPFVGFCYIMRVL